MAKRKWERQHHDRSDHGGTKAKTKTNTKAKVVKAKSHHDRSDHGGTKAKALVNAKARSRAVQHGVRVMGLG